MSVEIRDPRFRQIVGDSVTFERLATGFLFTEGALWHARDKYLLFSDMPGDHMRKWSAQDGVCHLPQARQSDGLTWDRRGWLPGPEHATSRVTRTRAMGRSR